MLTWEEIIRLEKDKGERLELVRDQNKLTQKTLKNYKIKMSF